MSKTKKGAILLFIALNCYAILCGGLYFFQENLIFHPTQLSQDFDFSFRTPYEEVFLDTPDGVSLHGLHFKNEAPKGTVLYYHGNAGDVSRWGDLVQYFVRQNLDVIVMDYRQYGKSTGALSEAALYEDAALWYAFAQAVSELNNTSLYVYGRSLGTTFATYVASRNEVSHLVLETPFYSIEHEAKSRFPILPVGALLKYKFPTASFVNEVTAPITIIHGTDDAVVDYDHGKLLFEHIKQPNKSFITVPDGGHNNLVSFSVFSQNIDPIFNQK